MNYRIKMLLALSVLMAFWSGSRAAAQSNTADLKSSSDVVFSAAAWPIGPWYKLDDKRLTVDGKDIPVSPEAMTALQALRRAMTFNHAPLGSDRLDATVSLQWRDLEARTGEGNGK